MFPIIAALLGAVVGSFLSQFFTHRRAVKDLNREAVADFMSQLNNVAYQMSAAVNRSSMGDNLIVVLSNLALPYEASLSRARLSISDPHVRDKVEVAAKVVEKGLDEIAAVRVDRPRASRAARQMSEGIMMATDELEKVAQERLLPDRWKPSLRRKSDRPTS